MRHGLSALAVAAALAVAVPAWAQETASADQAQGKQEEGKKAKKSRASRTLITKEQIDQAVEKGATTAYDVIQQLRHEWFRGRPDLSATTGMTSYAPKRPVVFMDNQVMGDNPELLRGVRPELLKEIKFLSGPDATTLFGTGYPHGVIQLITR